MSKKLQDAMLEELRPWIERGEVRVYPSDEHWVELIATRYPMLLGRIDWSVVPEARSSYFTEAAQHDEDNNIDEKPRIHAFLMQFTKSLNAGAKDKFIIVGDEFTDIALEASLDALPAILPIISEYPHHLYIITPDGKWRFMYSMERDMYYGKAPY